MLINSQPMESLGHARVKIDKLVYTDNDVRQFDPRNKDRLVSIFRFQGCCRDDAVHRVPALIEPELYHEADGNGFLDLSTPVRCLHGRHRLEAAKEFLPVGDQWWTVDFFPQDVSADGKAAIRRRYANESNISDGEIYRHLRLCVRASNVDGMNHWLSRLSGSMRRDIQRLEKLALLQRPWQMFRDSLDKLLDYPGLWPALQLGAFHRLLTIHCPEEMTRYVDRIHLTWARVCYLHRKDLDAATVRALEGKCPYLSSHDNANMEVGMHQRTIFAGIAEDGRYSILGNLRLVPYPIPSLHTFLEDTKYLEPCARIMKNLLPSKIKETLQKDFARHHDQGTTWQEERSEGRFVPKAAPNAEEARNRSYQQLWLFAFRHFPEMTGITPRKDRGRPKPKQPQIEKGWWQLMSNMASNMGFQGLSHIHGTRLDADQRMARDFLHQARPTQFYEFDTSAFDAEVRRICECLSRISRRTDKSDTPELSSERDLCGSDTAARCGRPHEQSLVGDRKFLFLRYMGSNIRKSGSGKPYITSFAIKHAMFANFFLELDDPQVSIMANVTDSEDTTVALSPTDSCLSLQLASTNPTHNEETGFSISPIEPPMSSETNVIDRRGTTVSISPLTPILATTLPPSAAPATQTPPTLLIVDLGSGFARRKYETNRPVIDINSKLQRDFSDFNTIRISRDDTALQNIIHQAFAKSSCCL
ncbi:MAG: hypothetical protein Q9217_001790 [Psora testacea]